LPNQNVEKKRRKEKFFEVQVESFLIGSKFYKKVEKDSLGRDFVLEVPWAINVHLNWGKKSKYVALNKWFLQKKNLINLLLLNTHQEELMSHQCKRGKHQIKG